MTEAYFARGDCVVPGRECRRGRNEVEGTGTWPGPCRTATAARETIPGCPAVAPCGAHVTACPVRHPGQLLGTEGQQAARRPCGRPWCLAGQAVRCLFTPARDAHHHDGHERYSQCHCRDACHGNYPDLIHASSFSLGKSAGRRESAGRSQARHAVVLPGRDALLTVTLRLASIQCSGSSNSYQPVGWFKR